MKTYETYKDSGIEWLGQIPGHWEIVKMKYLVNLQSGSNLTADQIQEEGQYPVYGGNGLRGFYHSFSDDGEYVLIGRQGALCGNINYAKGKFWATEHAVVCYPKQPFALTWLGELLRTMNLNQYSESAAQPGLSVEKIKQLLIPVPSLSEQDAIASYLDFRVGQIDLLIAEKEKQMKDLQQYRMSLISETVTHGLNPDVKMKESGVEWLGRIPEHWEVVELKKLLSEKLKYGASEQGTAYDESLPRYIRITDFDSNGRLKEENKLSLPFEKAKDYLLENNDVLFARSGATVGKSFIFLVDDHTDKVCCFAGYLIRAKCDSSKLLPMFLFSYTNSYSFGNWKNMIATKATIENISADKYATLPIPVPPLSEQQAVVSFLDEKTARIDSTLKELETQIADLRCYKTSVITEAVTGKVDVRQWKQT